MADTGTTTPPPEDNPGPSRRCRLWRQVIDLSRVLWVCRLSVLSVAFGAILLGAADQAQDLFFESKGDIWETIVYWALFFVLVFLFWAVPVHYMARAILYFEHWLTACPHGTDAGARDEIFKDAQKRFAGKVRAVPRALGMVVFPVAAIGPFMALRGQLPSDDAYTQTQLWILIAICMACIPVFHVYARKRRPLIAYFARLISNVPVARSALPTDGHDSERSPAFIPLRTDAPDRGDRLGLLRRGFAIPIIVLFTVVLAGWFYPLDLAERLPRALFIPFVLTVPFYFLWPLVYWSHRFCAPTTAVTLTLLALLWPQLERLNSPAFRTIHDVREIARTEPAARLTFDQALLKWKQENGECLFAREKPFLFNQARLTCPPPIILAIAGGASRSGFYGATVIGEILDRAYRNVEGKNDPVTQIFAISGVSGGSFAAATFAAAIAASNEMKNGTLSQASNRPVPCTTDAPLWFGSSRTDHSQREGPWRDCLQKLTSGDYLTPVFVGMSLRDISSRGWWHDRGALLEKAWERHFTNITDSDAFTRPFLSFAPKVGDAAWTPLLFLNGTSVHTGRRIVVSPLEPVLLREDAQSRRRLFRDAFDAHELQDAEPTDDEAPGGPLLTCDAQPVDPNSPIPPPASDMALSTAVTYSARFPVISPHGDIRGNGDCLADRVVDGGYFENYGATTALEIAEALRGRGADPFVLMITNDPEPPQGADDPLRQTVSEREIVRIRGGLPTAIAPTVGGENSARWDSLSPVSLEEWNQGPDAREKKYSRCPITRPSYDRNGPPHPRDLTEPPQLALFAPVMTLFATRTARGTYSGRELSEKLNDGRNLCGFRRIGVFDDCKSRRQPDCPDLSMSWWLSYPVQEFLDTQMRESLPHSNNQAALSEIDCILSKKPTAECYAEPATLSNRP